MIGVGGRVFQQLQHGGFQAFTHTAYLGLGKGRGKIHWREENQLFFNTRLNLEVSPMTQIIHPFTTNA
jgi:hypothetical protein